MTALGLSTAAAPEAAALFPLSAAGSPAAEGVSSKGGTASTTFGDLLAANVALSEEAQDAGADSAGAAFNTLSPADVWFAGLTVDLDALNASLEAEEADVLPDDADVSDAEDEENAGLMAFAVSVPVPAPTPVPIPVPADGPADAAPEMVSASSDTTAGSVRLPWPEPSRRQPGSGVDAAAVPGSPVGPASSGASGEARGLAAQADVTGATFDASAAPSSQWDAALDASAWSLRTPGAPRENQPVDVAAASAVPDANLAAADTTAAITLPAPRGTAGTAAPSAQAADIQPEVSAGLAPRAAAGGAAPSPEAAVVQPEASAGLVPRATTGTATQSSEAPDVSVAPTAPPEMAGDQLPTEELVRAIHAAPLAQQAGRARESAAAPLGGSQRTRTGESGQDFGVPPWGQVVGQVPSDPPGGSQSQMQDEGAEDAFGTGVSESAAAARSTDGAAVAPVFTVAPTVDAATVAAARAVVAAGPALPLAPASSSVPDPENVGRLVESMRVQVRQGVQEATVRLNPEHMGEVTISVRVDRGVVSAVVHAETPAVQQWLESQEEKLRSGLSDQGLQLERFIVQRDRSHERREQPQRQQQPAPRYRQQRDDSAVRFEVMV